MKVIAGTTRSSRLLIAVTLTLTVSALNTVVVPALESTGSARYLVVSRDGVDVKVTFLVWPLDAASLFHSQNTQSNVSPLSHWKHGM